jgi:hypothetical protein
LGIVDFFKRPALVELCHDASDFSRVGTQKIGGCPLYHRKQILHRTGRRLIFRLEIVLNQPGNFQIVAFGSLA